MIRLHLRSILGEGKLGGVLCVRISIRGGSIHAPAHYHPHFGHCPEGAPYFENDAIKPVHVCTFLLGFIASIGKGQQPSKSTILPFNPKRKILFIYLCIHPSICLNRARPYTPTFYIRLPHRRLLDQALPTAHEKIQAYPSATNSALTRIQVHPDFP